MGLTVTRHEGKGSPSPPALLALTPGTRKPAQTLHRWDNRSATEQGQDIHLLQRSSNTLQAAARSKGNQETAMEAGRRDACRHGAHVVFSTTAACLLCMLTSTQEGQQRLHQAQAGSGLYRARILLTPGFCPSLSSQIQRASPWSSARGRLHAAHPPASAGLLPGRLTELENARF